MTLILFCGQVQAQENAARLDRTLLQLQRATQAQVIGELPTGQRAFIDYGAYATVGHLSFDDSAHNNHGAGEYELVGYGDINFDGAHEAYFRGRGDYFDYNPGDSINNEPNHVDGRVEEAWYRFDLRGFDRAYRHKSIEGDIDVKAGRQFVAWGNGLTLDQYADGISASVITERIEVDLLACATVRETVDFDTSRPDFYKSTHRGFYGGRIVVPIGRQRPYAFFLLQQDYNQSEPINAHVIPTRYHYNSYYVGAGSNGTIGDHLTYGGEVCFEGGRDLSNSYALDASGQTFPVAQTTDSISAWAADLRFDYLPNDARRSRFTLEGILASGDSDRTTSSGTFGGNQPNTVDRAYNGLGVIYDGLAFAAPVSNLLALRVGASTYPLPRTKWFRELQVGTDFFVFGKTLAQAPIDEPTSNKHYLGCEPDLMVNWQITDDLTLIARYGLFVPGAAIPPGKSDFLRQFLYLSVTYAF